LSAAVRQASAADQAATCADVGIANRQDREV
jgi:hypothetical protein